MVQQVTLPPSLRDLSLFLVCLFDTGSHCVVLTDLERNKKTRIATN